MRWTRLFETTTPSGHHGPDLYFAPRPDGGGTLRAHQGGQYLDVPLTAQQCDELASLLLQGIYDAQNARRYWPTRQAMRAAARK